MKKKSTKSEQSFDIIKRLIDVVGALVLVTIFSPIMVLTALIIKFTSKGPILVEKNNLHMKRVGKNEKNFRASSMMLDKKLIGFILSSLPAGRQAKYSYPQAFCLQQSQKLRNRVKSSRKQLVTAKKAF